MITCRHGASRRGMTLLECLVYAAVLSVVAVFIMRALGEGAKIRGMARHRAELALIAQSELERIRMLPPTDLREGTTTGTSPAWPRGTECLVTLNPAPAGAWTVEVAARREMIEGLKDVRLTTVRMGATP